MEVAWRQHGGSIEAAWMQHGHAPRMQRACSMRALHYKRTTTMHHACGAHTAWLVYRECIAYAACMQCACSTHVACMHALCMTRDLLHRLDVNCCDILAIITQMSR